MKCIGKEEVALLRRSSCGWDAPLKSLHPAAKVNTRQCLQVYRVSTGERDCADTVNRVREIEHISGPPVASYHHDAISTSS